MHCGPTNFIQNRKHKYNNKIYEPTLVHFIGFYPVKIAVCIYKKKKKQRCSYMYTSFYYLSDLIFGSNKIYYKNLGIF